MTNPNSQIENVNPWNYNEKAGNNVPPKCPSLAVDLSIWICEALTSMAMSNNHANPALHLVTLVPSSFSVSVSSLFSSLKGNDVFVGLKVMVSQTTKRNSLLESVSGLRGDAETACVPVVRAKAEGEALCAILNQKGIVDGVISNDGDCFLFGAKVLYTKFSIENLQQSQVMRYDATELYARVHHETEAEEEQLDETHRGACFNDNDENSAIIKLSRDDLVAFALLTGSDLAGDGLPKVGYKKAVRFIRKCQLDYPLSKESATLDELKSWANTATRLDDCQLDDIEAPRLAAVRLPPSGRQTQPRKYGCEICGTGPGEACFDMSQEDVFRKSIKSKALKMMPRFDPAQVLAAYMKPNDNQIPFSLSGVTSDTLQMSSPRLSDMLSSSLMIKGRCLAGSREFVTQSLSRLLARTDLFRHQGSNERTSDTKRGLSKETPVPLRITKRLVRNRVPCYEVEWTVNATVTDAEGNAVDGYEFSTIESQAMVEKSYPGIVEEFDNMQEELEKQGDAEACRRRTFIDKLINNGGETATNQIGKQPKKREQKKRSGFFEKQRSQEATFKKQKAIPFAKFQEGDDVRNLRQLVRKNREGQQDVGSFDFSSIEDDCSNDDSHRLQGAVDEITDGVKFFLGSPNSQHDTSVVHYDRRLPNERLTGITTPSSYGVNTTSEDTVVEKRPHAAKNRRSPIEEMLISTNRKKAGVNNRPQFSNYRQSSNMFATPPRLFKKCPCCADSMKTFRRYSRSSPGLIPPRDDRLCRSHNSDPARPVERDLEPSECFSQASRVPCYEVERTVNATDTDAEGNADDGYEFSTIESQTTVEKSYPGIVEEFDNMQEELERQGDAEACRRRTFIDKLINNGGETAPNQIGKQPKKRELKKRSGFFEKQRSREATFKKQRTIPFTRFQEGDDVRNLRQLVRKNREGQQDVGSFDFSSIEDDCSKEDSDKFQGAVDEITDGVGFFLGSPNSQHDTSVVHYDRRLPNERLSGITTPSSYGMNTISEDTVVEKRPHAAKNRRSPIKKMLITTNRENTGVNRRPQIANYWNSSNMIASPPRLLVESPCADSIKTFWQCSRHSPDPIPPPDDRLRRSHNSDSSRPVGRDLDPSECVSQASLGYSSEYEEYEPLQLSPLHPRRRIVVCHMGIDITMSPISQRWQAGRVRRSHRNML